MQGRYRLTSYSEESNKATTTSHLADAEYSLGRHKMLVSKDYGFDLILFGIHVHEHAADNLY
jgi:hypothetical protein